MEPAIFSSPASNSGIVSRGGRNSDRGARIDVSPNDRKAIQPTDPETSVLPLSAFGGWGGARGGTSVARVTTSHPSATRRSTGHSICTKNGRSSVEGAFSLASPRIGARGRKSSKCRHRISRKGIWLILNVGQQRSHSDTNVNFYINIICRSRHTHMDFS
jgi:hypothetical protein